MTVPDTNPSTPILITGAEIARLAGVRPSAVSNWKRRHPDFPTEAEEGLFDRAQIVAWLRAAGKSVHLPEQDSIESAVLQATYAVRDLPGVFDTPEVLLQLFALRAAASGRYERLTPLARAWGRIEAANDPGLVYSSTADALTMSDPDLARALRVSSVVSQLRPSDWTRLIETVGHFHPRSTDWGDASTVLLEDFAKRRGAKAGNVDSGPSLVDIMTALLEPLEGTVYDPACGRAVFLGSTWERYSDTVTQLYGQEIREQTWRLGFLHLLLQGASFQLVTGDTMVDDRLWQLRADRIAVEPPFGLRLASVEQMDGDPRWFLGLPPKGHADLAWVQHVVFHLADSGIGVVVLPTTALTRRGRSEVIIRTGLLEADYVDAVLYLPPGMLTSVSIPTAILVLQKDRVNRAGRVLFLDARQLGTPERGGVRSFQPPEIVKIGRTIQRWRDGRLEPEAQFSGIGTTDEIVANGSALGPSRYIQYAVKITEINGEPIRSRQKRLTTTVKERLAALPTVEATIRQQLSAIDPVDGPSFSHHRLGDLLITDPLPGIRQREGGEGDPTPYVTTGMVIQGQPILANVPAESTFGHVRGRMVRRGDLLLVTRGIDGHRSVACAIVRFDVPASFSNWLIRLRPDQRRLDPDYLRLYLTSRRGRAALAGAATGSVIANLRHDTLKDIEVHLPALEEQKALVACLTAIETQMSQFDETLEACRTTYDTVREGLVAGILSLRNAMIETENEVGTNAHR